MSRTDNGIREDFLADNVIDTNNQHFYPINDLKRHITVGRYCPCKPVVMPEGDNAVIIHQSYNGIEFADNVPLDDYLNPCWFYESWINEAPKQYDGH